MIIWWWFLSRFNVTNFLWKYIRNINQEALSLHLMFGTNPICILSSSSSSFSWPQGDKGYWTIAHTIIIIYHRMALFVVISLSHSFGFALFWCRCKWWSPSNMCSLCCLSFSSLLLLPWFDQQSRNLNFKSILFDFLIKPFLIHNTTNQTLTNS